MMFVRALALLLALSGSALAQSGQIPSGTVWGNSGASKAVASPATVTAIFDRALGSTRGSIIERGAAGWAQLGPGATAGFPFVSSGAGADPGYARLGLVGGGTNADLSATGGASQFLRQNSVGAAITVVRPACADLSNASASCSTDATNATNIGSGSLNILRFPSIAANTAISNWTSGSAVPLANAYPSCANDGNHALVYVNGSGLACATITKVTGTTTNDNASAGNVGEYVSAAGSGVALTSGINANATSISLTAGDWDVSANIQFAGTGSTTLAQMTAGISTTSAVLPSAPGGYFRLTHSLIAGDADNVFAVGTVRMSLAGTTTVYLVAQALITASTLSVNSVLNARRAR